MGREEIGEGTGKVTPFVCCMTYLVAAPATIIFVFAFPLSENPILNGFAAHMLTNLVIFGFSYSQKNSSLIDPSWYLLPLFTCTGWFVTGNGVSTRGACAYGLVFLWACRFLYQWPWEGWKEGLTHEDWRFVDFAKKLGPNSIAYWLMSLLGFHSAQSLMNFLAVAPLQAVWTIGKDGKDLDAIDILGLAIMLTAILVSFFADK